MKKRVKIKHDYIKIKHKSINLRDIGQFYSNFNWIYRSYYELSMLTHVIIFLMNMYTHKSHFFFLNI